MMSQLATLGIFASGGGAPAATFRSIVFGSGEDGGGLTGTMEALTVPMTFMAWVKWAGGASSFPVLLESATGDESIYFQSSNRRPFARSGGGTAVGSGTTLDASTWGHVCVQWKTGNDVTLIVNKLSGTSDTATVTSSAVSELISSGTLWLGQDAAQTKDFPGKLFDAVLIQGLYAPADLNFDAGTTTPGWVDFTWPSSTPGARWSGKTSGTPGADASGNGNTLTQPSGTSTAVTLDAADTPPAPV